MQKYYKKFECARLFAKKYCLCSYKQYFLRKGLSFARSCERTFGGEVVPVDRGKPLTERGIVYSKGRAESTTNFLNVQINRLFFLKICIYAIFVVPLHAYFE